MKQILYSIWFYVLATTCVCAQEFTVRSMNHRQTDLSARSHVRNDQNGEPCALVRVELPLDDVVFDGNIVGSVERYVNEYWVYMTAGSKKLEIKHPKCYTLEVLFPDYSISSVENLQTYRLIVNTPLVVEPKADAIVPVPIDNTTPIDLKKKSSQTLKNRAVDLGLSVKWGAYNVGADTPEDSGYYFAWAETQGYTKDTLDGRSFDYSHLKYSEGTSYRGPFSKYVMKQESGNVDNKNVLESVDDAATVNLGGNWRMPTREEMQELIDNCTCLWTTYKGTQGIKVIGKNGNSIFIPAVGYRKHKILRNDNKLGHYWSSSLYSDASEWIYAMFFDGNNVRFATGARAFGFSVRPVCTSFE